MQLNEMDSQLKVVALYYVFGAPAVFLGAYVVNKLFHVNSINPHKAGNGVNAT